MYKIIGADQKEYGPVSAEQIRQWIAEGRVNGQTRAQAADGTEWRTVADFPEFAVLLPKAPPPAPAAAPISLNPVPPRTSGMAVWAMALGIASLICCCVAGPVAIVLGAVALSQMKSHPELTGRGFAIAGIVLGIVSILIYTAFGVFCFSNPDFMQNLQRSMQQ